MKALRPLFLIVSLILIVGLACSFGNSSNPTAQPTKEAQATAADSPTDEPTLASDNPTDEPTQSDEPTATEEASSGGDAQEYYTETFDGNLDNYTWFNTGKGDDKDKKKFSLITKDGFLVFDLKGENLWIYVTYNPFTYKDVALEVTADNRGKNNNNVSLVCRYNPDEGWYEFNIYNNGLYDIFAYDATGAVNKGYNKIADGASKAIKQGRNVNTYGVSCIDDKLSLTINDTEVTTVTDRKYQLREGKVGFGVSSFNTVPILVNVDSFTVSEP